MVGQLIDHIELEIVTLYNHNQFVELMRYVHDLLALFPRMRGPGKVPPARTVGRLKPSGARFWLTMCRSVTGPMAEYEPVASAMAKRGLKR